MTTTSITPDQIKAIATEMRRSETDRLGACLPNTTALNAITRALGLAADFRAFKATFDAAVRVSGTPSDEISRDTAAGADRGAIISRDLMIVLENPHDDEMPGEDWALRELTDMIDVAGMTVDISPGAHGASEIRVQTPGDGCTIDDLTHLRDALLAHIDVLHYDGDMMPSMASALWETRAGDGTLSVNFRYLDTGQICTAHVPEAAWRARGALGLDDATCLLLSYGDVEIPSHYRADEIAVDDVMRSVVFYESD